MAGTRETGALPELSGGAPARPGIDIAVQEIACDESGYEGEKLIDTTKDVFAHASVQVTGSSAAECIRELRRRIKSPATQYKSSTPDRIMTIPTEPLNAMSEIGSW